ncbi:hypothetical protein O0I10_006377 [Lichtheimia ornata]|uniref:Uncharacterized protein n=1 Tax=Lichtheimia ornata TaxID=688661 RepID=A0AAD7V1Z2_9FUNG|nr:uncharacterized protein O0I10_006377 [Lichtheimia ornata]KAJ8657849.1 hypothetical protein O0I10_006377 [Lichtheimia ornata]
MSLTVLLILVIAQPCEKPAPPQEEQPHERRQLPTDDAEEDDPSRLGLDELTSIGHSNDVLKYLENPRIRELVSHIDRSTDPEKELTNARSEDSMLEEFIQLLLRTTGRKRDDEQDS